MYNEKKIIRSVFFVAAGCIVLYWLLHETERVRAAMTFLGSIFRPFVYGSVLAFILNVPMRAIERGLKGIQREGVRRGVAIVLTFVVLLLVIVGVFLLLIPQISDTIQSLIPKLMEFALSLEQRVRAFLADNPELFEFIANNTDLENLNWSTLIEKAVTMVGDSVSKIASSALLAVGNVADVSVNAIIGFVFAIYCLANKEVLVRQSKKILYAFVPEKVCDEIVRILHLANVTFSNFISGQCIEACILGCLFAIFMAIFKMPYIPLVSVLIAVTALIPLVGAFVGCILGAFFILVNSFTQAVWFVVMFLILQQIENNLIYPKVVGTSIGLPGMWVLVAVSIGGKIMGVVGMLLMIPFSSVLYALLREVTNKRIDKRNIAPDKLEVQKEKTEQMLKEHRKNNFLKLFRLKKKPAEDQSGKE